MLAFTIILYQKAINLLVKIYDLKTIAERGKIDDRKDWRFEIVYFPPDNDSRINLTGRFSRIVYFEQTHLILQP